MRAQATNHRGVSSARAGVLRERFGARRVFIVAAMAGVSAVFIGAVLAAVLIARAPGWWHRIDPSDPALEVAGAGLEHTVAGELSRVRPGAASASPSDRPWRSDEWTVDIRADEATAWLNARLRKWLANRDASLPDQVREIEVAFGEGQVRLGAALAVGDHVRILSAGATPRVGDDGSLWLHETRVYAGRLPLPASWIAGGKGPEWLVRELREAPGFDAALRVLAGEAALAERPVITLGDGRQVRVVGLEVHEGRVRVTCRTEAAAISAGE